MKRFMCLIFAILPGRCLTSCFPNKEGKSVIVASKQFTENIVLSEIYAQLIEAHTDIEVERKQSLGSTNVCFNALTNGETDIYVEYTGTIYSEFLKLQTDTVPENLYETVKDDMNKSRNITVFQPIGLNNTFALAMHKEKAAALGIETISDMNAGAAKLVFGAPNTFYTRYNDGYESMVKKYNLQFESAIKMDSAFLYEAIDSGQVDVIVVYTTDSLLKTYGVVLMDDNLKLFPEYYAVPIARNETLKENPELNDVLSLLTNRIDDERMQELNYMVDADNKSASEVAKEFLLEQELLN